MNEAQRSVLQQHLQELAKDIIVTEELLGALFQNKVFERGMIEIIRAEKTPSDQVYKMLSMLPRRGPDAFDTFLRVIQDDYHWLSSMLEASYKSQMSLSRSDSVLNRDPAVCNSGRDAVDAVASPRQLDFSCLDADIKTRVGTFVHKQFGQSKRISEKDKKAMERWFSEQLYLERKRLESTVLSQTEGESDSDSVDGKTQEQYELQQMQEKLDLLYGKLRLRNTADTVNNNEESEVPCITPGLASFPMIEVEVNSLIEKLEQLESCVYQSYLILGDNERKQALPSLIHDLQYEKCQQEKELNRERQKIEKMLTELYDYSKTINKLETQRNQMRIQLEHRASEIQRLSAETGELSLRCKNLEAINNQHMEKEKTLENLRRMVKELKSSKDTAIDENMNNRNRYSTDIQASLSPRPNRRSTRGVPLGTNRRGSLAEFNMNISNRRTVARIPMNTKKKPFPSYNKPS